MPRDCCNGARLEFGFPSVRFPYPRFLDFGVGIKAGDEALEKSRAISRR